jgi:hypothetical protein
MPSQYKQQQAAPFGANVRKAGQTQQKQESDNNEH